MDCAAFTTEPAAPSLSKTAETVAIPAMLPALNLAGLVAYYDAVVAACDGALGILNQPRVHGICERLLSDRCELLDREAGLIAAMIKRYTPEDEAERRDRAYFLISYECRCGAGLDEVASLAASLAVKRRN